MKKKFTSVNFQKHEGKKKALGRRNNS
jgi:hypothetical protein